MPRIRIDKPVRGALLDELIAGGIAPVTPEGEAVLTLDRDNLGGWLVVEDEDEQAAHAIIAAHDAAAIDQDAAQERTRYQQDIANLKAFQSVASPTNTQTAAAVKALSRVLKHVVAELRD
jgi:hypothetical protein